MDVIEAILNRHSVRDFSSKPVPKDVIMKILELATHSPSGGNGQPWEVFVATGASLDNIRRIYQERFQNGIASFGPPTQLPDFILKRMAANINEMINFLGLNPNDPASFKVIEKWGSMLFGVPVLVVTCMDKALSSNLDIGLFTQTICIAAQGYGVDSLIAMAFIAQQDVLRQGLKIPDNLNIITGIGLGYPNQNSIIKNYRSSRRPISEVVRYRS
ncbi:MAG: nitroreductase [Dehalococcoidales bacterium]|nr:nitroreductase [Dehalococcoidales bacterium]